MFNNLLAEMARNRINQTQLAEVLHVSQKTVSNKLKGKSEFTLSELNKIMGLFEDDVSFDYLFGPKDAGCRVRRK